MPDDSTDQHLYKRVHSVRREGNVSGSVDSSPAAISPRDVSAVYQLIRPLRYYVYVRKVKLQLVSILEMRSLVKLEPYQAPVLEVFSALLYLRLTD